MIGTVINKLLKPLSLRLVKIQPAASASEKVGRRSDRYWDKQQYLEKTEFKYILWLDRLYDQIGEVPGHIVELGVAYGRNAILFSHMMRMRSEEDVRKYYGFDTFAGYSESSLEGNTNLSEHAWKNNSKEQVEERLKRAGVANSCQLFEGDILKTVPAFTDENPHLRIALLYIDCNAYEPAIFALEALRPFMTPGGIICLDEKKQGGETKALIEFCEKHGLRFQRDSSPFSIPAYTRMPATSKEKQPA